MGLYALTWLGRSANVRQAPKKIGEDIAKASGEWKGLRVTVQLTVRRTFDGPLVSPSTPYQL